MMALLAKLRVVWFDLFGDSEGGNFGCLIGEREEEEKE